MTAATRLRYLRVALILVGLIFIFGIYPLMMALWPSGWRWSLGRWWKAEQETDLARLFRPAFLGDTELDRASALAAHSG
jgi:hypothetical protein